MMVFSSEERKEDGTTCTPEWNVAAGSMVIMVWQENSIEQDIIGLPKGTRKIEF